MGQAPKCATQTHSTSQITLSSFRVSGATTHIWGSTKFTQKQQQEDGTPSILHTKQTTATNKKHGGHTRGNHLLHLSLHSNHKNSPTPNGGKENMSFGRLTWCVANPLRNQGISSTNVLPSCNHNTPSGPVHTIDVNNSRRQDSSSLTHSKVSYPACQH